MKFLIIKDFDLKKTITSGHFFSYEEKDDGYDVLDGTKFFVKQNNNKLYYNTTTKHIKRFFNLDKDLSKLYRTKDPILKKAIEQNKGVRLIHADLRTTIISFILSSNNNMKRIKKMVDFLRKRKFKIPSEQILREAGFGYRAKYLAESNKLMTKTFLEELKKMDFHKARETLMILPGVGPKVADCILAYSELAMPAFPVDVWVGRALEWYGLKNDKNLIKEVHKRWGEDAAYVQHYLFMAAQQF